MTARGVRGLSAAFARPADETLLVAQVVGVGMSPAETKRAAKMSLSEATGIAPSLQALA